MYITLITCIIVLNLNETELSHYSKIKEYLYYVIISVMIYIYRNYRYLQKNSKCIEEEEQSYVNFYLQDLLMQYQFQEI